MKKICLIVFLLLFKTVFSQNISINWKDKTDIVNDSARAVYYPFFDNGNFSVLDDLPVFSYTEKVSAKKKVSLSNLVWKQIDKSSLYDLKPQYIPEKEKYSANIGKARNEYYLNIQIFPFKKVNNQIYRLESFTYNLSDNIPQSSVQSVVAMNSILSSDGKIFYKIKVDTTGIFKITKSFLLAHLPSSIVNAINPKNIRIYGNGGKMLSEKIDDFRYTDLQENAIQVVGEEDGNFDADDYILFYAQGAHIMNYSELGTASHQTNIYDDYAYYYINFDIGIGKRVSEQNSQNASNYFTTYDDYRFYEPELYNIYYTGRIWVGENFSLEDTQTINFNTHSLVETEPVKWKLALMTSLAQNQTINFSINNNSLFNTTIGVADTYYDWNVTSNANLTGNTIQAKITVDNAANPSGKVYFNYIELQFKQNLRFNGTQMNFRRNENLNDNQVYGFLMSNSSAMEQIWNVSDITNAIRVKELISGGDFDFSYQSNSANFHNEFVAFNQSSAYIPEWVGVVEKQNLHGISNVDYIIVSPKEFLTEANKLKNYHQTENNLQVTIVTPQQIYNEFSSGSQDITALRDFFRYVYQTGNQRLKYILLLGDSSYDYKNRIANNQNIIPSHQSYDSKDVTESNGWVTDDFFTILDDGENANLYIAATEMDVAIGRIPAGNVNEATLLVSKILQYNNKATTQSNNNYSPFGDWRLKAHLITDIEKGSLGSFHKSMEESTANWMETNRQYFTIRKLYMDAFQGVSTPAGLRFPDVNAAINNAVETGSLFINYFGHGGIRGWSQKRILLNEDMTNYNNINYEFARMPFVITITCEFTVWDNPNLISGGELFIKKANGGAVGLITTSRLIAVFYGEYFNDDVVKNLLTYDGNNYRTVGEALRVAKVNYQFGNTTDHLNVNLLCDPAIPLAFPPRGINIRKINGIDANTFTGTLQALDFVTIEGEVLNTSATATDTTYNGTLDATLYDKETQRTTLSNPNATPNGETLEPYTYNEQINAIYKGSTSVTNGLWKLQFYVPKDINYQIGNGKLVLYANNHKNKQDAKTFKNDIKVGGINPDGIDDDEGPAIKLFMNNIHFANGGITDRNPVFIACVTDSTGINSSGLGIGHDITAVLDGNIDGTIVLNEFYQGGEQSPCLNPALKDYQKGKVAYQFNNLEVGNHSILFKVWDINNNSSTAALDFIVMNNGDDKLVINRPMNWPNPFTDKTYFHFEHNCPEILEVQVQIFTISGKLIKTIRQNISSEPFREGYRTDKFGIPWDGLDDFGDKVGKGVYIYRLNIKGQNGETCKGTASAIEKLVILK